MDISREQQQETEQLADFAVSVEKSRVSKDQKRLCIRRGSHTESVALNASEAQVVIMNLMQAFPGTLNELLEAARPLGDLMFNPDPEDALHTVEVYGGSVTRLKSAIIAVDDVAAAHYA